MVFSAGQPRAIDQKAEKKQADTVIPGVGYLVLASPKKINKKWTFGDYIMYFRANITKINGK